MGVVFQKAVFVKSSVGPNDFLVDRKSLLFAGRSNAGKSTLINALTLKKDLMKTSARPGKTRMVNYALIDDRFYLADSPGYGFEADRNYFTKLMGSYFKASEGKIAGIVLVIDSRRGVMASDADMEAYAASLALPVVYVFTKADKLNRTEKRNALAKFRKDHPDSPIYFSDSKNQTLLDAIRKGLTQLVLTGKTIPANPN